MVFKSNLSDKTGATRIKNGEKIPKKLLLFKACERGNQLYVCKNKINNVGTTNKRQCKCGKIPLQTLQMIKSHLSQILDKCIIESV